MLTRFIGMILLFVTLVVCDKLRPKTKRQWSLTTCKRVGVHALSYMAGFILIRGLVYSLFLVKYPGASMSALLVVASMFGFFEQRRCDHMSKVIGSTIGGALGGVLLVLVHFILAYTGSHGIEDEGLGFIGCLVAFAPLAAIIGSLVGAVTWGALTCLIKLGPRPLREAIGANPETNREG